MKKSKTKAFVALLLAMSVFFTGFCLPISAAEVIKSGSCEENLTYTLDSNGVLTVSGNGGIRYASSHVWDTFKTKIKKLIIENGVTSIGQDAFKSCTNLTKIVLANSVTNIGSGAFRNCSRLSDITLGNDITSIGEDAFGGTSFYYDDNRVNGILYLGQYLLQADWELAGAVTVKAGTAVIADSAFYECSGLTAVTIPDSVAVIGRHAFYGCTGLTAVTVPDGVVTVGSGAFLYCSSLSDISVSDSVLHFGSNAFVETAFYNTDSNWTDGVLYLGSYLLEAKSGITGAVTVKAGTKKMADEAFFCCTGLTAVTVPEGVTCIGDYAFCCCDGLTEISLPDSITYLGSDAFSECRNLTQCNIPTQLTAIQSYVFSGTGLTDVTLPDNLLSVGDGAFSNCNNLQSVTLNEGLVSIGSGAFNCCTALESIRIPDSVTKLGEFAFGYCSSIRRVTMGKNIKSLECGVFAYCTKLTEINLPNQLTAIGNHAFENCNALSALTIPDSVTSLGFQAFFNCTGLTEITIPKSITDIQLNAFFGCTGLQRLTLEPGLKTVGEAMFCDCTGLTELMLPVSVTFIGESAFNGCTGLTMAYIPSSVTDIGAYAFYSCNNLTIYGKIGTQAEKYAKDNDIPFMNSNGFITGTINNIDVKNNFTYTDDYFSLASDEYHHDFAKFALNVTTAVAVNDNAYDAVPAYAKEFFNKIGFGDDKGEYFVPYGYDKKENDSIACCIASKNIDENDETILIIGVRGAGYMWEWGGNFNVGQSDNHTGFTLAAKTVKDRLDSFITLYDGDFNSHVKILITGYSRAAATSNLVGSYLDKEIGNGSGTSAFYRKLVQEKGFCKDDLFVYTFETPRNTTDKASHTDLYSNIFNIINPIDIVPKVAMADWGFVRYGTDCYMPSAETSGKDYKAYCSAMAKLYQDIAPGYTYKENFSFYEIAVVNDGTWYYPDINIKITENGSIGQGHYGDGLLRILAKDVIGSRYLYASKYQHAAMMLIPTFLCGGENEYGDILGDFTDNIGESLGKNLFDDFEFSDIFDIKEYLKSYAIECIKSSAAKALSGNITADNPNFDGKLSYQEAYELVGEVDDILSGLAQHPNYLYTTVMAFTQKHPYPANDILIMLPHTSQVTTAWMESITAKDIRFDSAGYRVVKYDCPIDITVYNKNGECCAKIINDEPQEVENGYIAAYIDENATKCFCLPYNESFTFEIRGTDSGTMNCTVCDFDYEAMDSIFTELYYDIPIEKNVTYTASLGETEQAQEKSVFTLTDEYDCVIASDTVYTQNEIPSYTVEVINNSQASVMGGGNFNEGQFAKLTAIESSGEQFIGWFVGDKMVSNEPIYRFCVKNDVIIEARFHKNTVLYGDLDGVDGVTVSDARLALRASVKLEKLTEAQLIAADVDGLDGVTASDARLILRYVVKLETKFPVEQ